MRHARILPLIVAATLLIAPSIGSTQEHSVEVKKGMGSLLDPLRKIQPYLADQAKFSDPQNKKEVSELLANLRDGFHSLETVPSRFHKAPGFDANLEMVSEMLQDSARRFNEGKPSYAWWRVRALPGACFACHATYQVDSKYDNVGAIDPSLDAIERARFLLATRQFDSAEKEILAILNDPSQRFYFGDALRSLLVIETRVRKDPKAAIKTFEKVLSESRLPEEDAADVQAWIESFERWAKAPAAKKALLADAEKLIASGLANDIDLENKDVELLRGTAKVHELMEREGITPDDRRRGLYLLGLSYANLPLFFADGWAELYLEQVITEFPGTDDAKRAFRVYVDHVTTDFSGSGGTDMPDDVQLRIDELRKKAFQIPEPPSRASTKESKKVG